MKHGNEVFYFQDEGLVNAPLFPEELFREENGLTGGFPLDLKPRPGEQMPEPTRIFCRLFEKGDQPNAEGLVALGMSMETEPPSDTTNNLDSAIPAGYTYLGQFIDHDITLLDPNTKLTEDGQVDPGNIKNLRTPSLVLDSLYLGGPEKNPELYNLDRKTFKIGHTSANLNLGACDNDLPRKGEHAEPGEKVTDAVIGDARNDENLAVAQTHLAFLKYHNAFAAANPNKSFEELRHEVTLHYQAIILTDFLPRILYPGVLNDVLQNGRWFYTDEKKDCMPIEFSVAAYRLHSMVRPRYQWNRIHNSNTQEATLGQLFEFSGGSGSESERDKPFGKFDTLPSDWIIDWRRFYEVEEKELKQLNYTRKIDTNMALGLKNLPQFKKIRPEVQPHFLSMATRNLLRGRLVSLPSGQKVAERLGEKALAPEDILKEVAQDQAKILINDDYKFHESTPLWYYILREAMVQTEGNHLGKVGSRIVAETFIGLIQNSSINVIDEQPELRFSMPELLKKIPGDIINPLGD
jgi:hypothetical protein